MIGHCTLASLTISLCFLRSLFHRHREAWQEVGRVLDSKANLSSYCQEVARQLEMNYQAPKVPVEISHANGHDSSTDYDADRLTKAFQDISRNKHQIRVC